MKKVLLTLTMLLFAFTGVTRANVQQNRADQVIEQGFEDGLGDWTMNHCHSSSGVSSSYGGNTGNYAFRFYYTTNYPQYLISPELDDNDGVNFTFYAARYSSNYPETFKVGYSSTTNDPTEFTWGSEVTCTTMYGAGEYQEYSYDFPAGTKYVSIACTSNDQFYLFIDDITVTATEPAPAPGGLVEVTIGDPTSTTTNQYLPGYTLYDYAISQQIYTADEIGVAGTINTLTMWLKNTSSYARNINVYMKEVEATEFASNTAWESFTAADMVASFTMPNENSTPIEIALPLDNPFVYSGTNNLVICFQDVTGQWSSGLGGVVMDASGNQAIYAYRDGTVYDPSNPGVNGTLLAKKNVIRLSIMTSGGAQTAFSTTPDVLDLGYRPNGAWMAPYTFAIKSNIGAATITALDFSGNYFTYNAELPATLTASRPLEVTLTTGEAEVGPVNSTMTVLFGGNRDAQQFDVTAYAYDPVEGDVWENAIDVTEFPYQGDAPEIIYKNYELPDATDNSEVMYKLTFDEDVLLTAGTEETDRSVALYPEGFMGEGGPMADNNYVYNGPQVNPGPISMWFNYAYTGSNTWYGTSAGGGMMWGYKITPEMLQELGLGNCAITTVESAARNSTAATFYDFFILKGGDTPDLNNMVYYQGFVDFTPGYYFDINLDEPQFLGDDENIWVMFYSDSPYAAYCGRNPVDTQNGKIWYTLDYSTWYSSTTYTPEMYTRFLELPTGREVTVNLADMKIRESKPAAGPIAEAEGNAMGTPKALRKQNNNRAVANDNIVDMYVPAGTYYLAVASGTPLFQVDIEVAEVPVPEQAVVYAPYDGETWVETPYLAEWELGDYTEEMQVLLGTQYPPQTALIDWTDELVESAFLMDLEPNQSYFMQVNERNAAGTTEGEIIAFTTPIDPVVGFDVEENELYPGDAAVFTWEANSRTLKGYNLYQDGVKINETPITETTYAVEGLEYNMEGYDFQVSAVYDAGESALSDIVTVYMTGFGSVTGYVYDLDTLHPIANANILALGVDEHGNTQEFAYTTDETGMYEGEILAGIYAIGIVTEGYQNEGITITVTYDQLTEVEDIFTHEAYYPLSLIRATEQEEENNVLVEWAWQPAEMIVNFETGDFSQAEFTLPATYPWAITTVNPHEGTYCMKSTCEGVASGTSSIEATVEVPYAAKMGFWVRVSSEANYDKFHFYIDGVEVGSALSGNLSYQYKEFSVAAGIHTYKWEYTKDSSVNSNDDCVYVDDITMFREDQPLPPPAPGEVTVILTAGDVWGDGSGYQMLLDDTHSLYGTTIPETGALSTNCSGNEGIYNQFSHKIPANADGNCSTSNIVINNSVTITIPSGIYDWCITNPTPGDRIWIAAANGNVGGRQDDYVFEGGNTYEFTISMYGSNDGVDVNITGGAKNSKVNTAEVANIDCKVADPELIVNSNNYIAPKVYLPVDRNNRSFQSFNLYRRNNIDEASVANPELIAEGIDAETFEYTDEAWATMPFGEYQWGIAATYDGYAPGTERSRETATFGFENGSLDGWTNIIVNTDGGEWLHSNNNLGGYDYTELAHTGTGFAMCYSYVDYDGPYDTKAYLVSPQKYSIDANSTITFWADNANDSYPEDFSVCVSTAATPAANNFTVVWSGGAKGNEVTEKAAVRHQNNRYENWRSHEVSLAAYAGQEVWIAFLDENYDMYEIWIDDITINYAGGSTPPTPPAPTGSGISEILWSNMIEKDMESTITFNVSQNNGQSPAGAAVLVEAVGNENVHYEGVVDETGTIDIVVRKGYEYYWEVTKEGYVGQVDFVTVTNDAYTFDVVLIEEIAPVAELYVSPTGWAMWDGEVAGSGGVTPPTPPTPPTPGQGWTEGFENGLPAGWEIVDANNDGYTWCLTSNIPSTWTYYATMTLDWYRSGSNAICSGSYINGVGALNPDEYINMGLQTIAAGSTLSFWAAATDASYPADHFGVFVSDNGTSWTSVQEWTLTGKSGGNDGGRASRDGKGAKLGTWYQFTADLSAYAGQKYVAIRHFNCYDQYIMCIDDIEFTAAKGDRTPVSYKVMLDGKYVGETYNPFYQHDVEGMEEGEEHVTAVAPLYSTGMGDWSEYTWTYRPCDDFAGVTEFNAVNNDENVVTLTWGLPGGTTPTPPPTPGQGWSEGFENGLPAGWEIVDANNDGYTWCLTSNIPSTWTYYATMTLDWYRTGSNAICSGSYINGVGALNPDEYIVMGQQTIAAGTTLSFWAAATDAGYPADHFGVFVSDNGTSWTSVQEWTLTGKSGGNDGGLASRDGKGAKLGTWYQYTVDLSAHAGQKYIAIRHFNCYDQYIMCVDDIEFNGGAKGNRAMWDLVYSFEGTSGYQYGVASDGENIYTSSWSSSSTSMFYKYDLQGNFIEEFNISGCGQCRGLTYDGQYFYGVANSSTIYCVDLANHTLVGSTTSAYGAMRAITYDPERDGFWVVGNWSGNLTLVDRTGAVVTVGATPTSASDVAYYKDPDGVEHVYCFNNGTNDVDDYNIATNTITSAVFTVSGSDITGSSGGCFVGAYDGKTCFFADIQQSPQHIGIYELDSNSTPVPPVPPTPSEGLVGTVLFRNGEFVSFFDANTTTYAEQLEEPGEIVYTIRVIYGGEPDVTYYAMSCGDDAAVISTVSVEENSMVNTNIYPNPTNGNVTIEAKGMTHITVVSSLGQVVYDADIKADMTQLNLGQFKAGLYMVRINTEEGVCVKRVTVVK